MKKNSQNKVAVGCISCILSKCTLLHSIPPQVNVKLVWSVYDNTDRADAVFVCHLAILDAFHTYISTAIVAIGGNR